MGGVSVGAVIAVSEVTVKGLKITTQAPGKGGPGGAGGKGQGGGEGGKTPNPVRENCGGGPGGAGGKGGSGGEGADGISAGVAWIGTPEQAPKGIDTLNWTGPSGAAVLEVKVK